MEKLGGPRLCPSLCLYRGTPLCTGLGTAVRLEHGACVLMSVPRPQYAILMTMVLTIFIKYVLHSVDLQSENPWDNKAVYMLYTELFTGETSLDLP